MFPYSVAITLQKYFVTTFHNSRANKANQSQFTIQFNEYLLSACYVPGNCQGDRDTAVNNAKFSLLVNIIVW
jgi:hypothetical protein